MTDTPDFVAQKHDGYWTIQVRCGNRTRNYVIRMDDGGLFELPDDRVPFVAVERSGGYTDCEACDGNGCDRCMPHLFDDTP